MRKDEIRLCFAIISFVFFEILIFQASASTEPSDVIALQDLYRSLNSPKQLIGWKSDGGHPCPESWTGITCSGSSVIHLKLRGLNLSGFLGVHLDNLYNLKHMDLSSNYITGAIPYGLPPNVTYINLAYNNLEQNIPQSLSEIKFLRHLNLSHNSFSGPIGNVFTGLHSLKEMDLSHNNFTGDLPSSFCSLKNLSRLFLQDNQFTGSVVYLAELPLTDLNIQSNHFSGVIPTEFQLIPNLWIDGNKFHIGSNYPPWKFNLDGVPFDKNFSGPNTTESSAMESCSPLGVSGRKSRKLSGGGLAGIVGGVILTVTFAAIFVALWIKKSRLNTRNDYQSGEFEVTPHLLPIMSSPNLNPRPCPMRTEKLLGRNGFAQRCKSPTTSRIYTIVELQSATNNFSEENFIGEGSLGSVYKADFPDGDMVAVKNINMVSLSFHGEKQFLDVIWTVSRLRHPNISTLLGYCIEQGQHLIVYEFIGNLSLDDALHTEGFRPLSWNLRLEIALGVARALDIKAANILLDENLKPRLTDTGLAVLRSLTGNCVKLKASEVAITYTGYLAPEHGKPGVDSTKSDIYAFGVLLLELLTGRRPYDSSRPSEEQSLAKWALYRLHDSEFLAQMVDPAIKRSTSSKSLLQFADIVSLCIQPEKSLRPAMPEIVESLLRMVQTLEKARDDAGTELDTIDKSFRSAKTWFMSSPTLSYVSICDPMM